MCDERLFYSTKDIVRYLVDKGPTYQTAYSLNDDFYNYAGLNIPFYELGFSCLLSFLTSIPDILEIDSLTLEVYPAKKSHRTRDTPQLSNYRNKAVRSPDVQSCNFLQSSTTSLYQPCSLPLLPWARSNLTQSCQRAFRPITKKPDPIIDNDSSDTYVPLGHRSFGDGKCSSPDSFKSRNDQKLPRKVDQQHQVKASTTANYCNNPTTNTSDFVNMNEIHHSPSVATEDEHFKFEKDLENRNQQDHSATSFELDHSTASITSIANDASAISELIFRESPPYLESEDGAIGPLNDGIGSYDYELDYYLSSSDEKVSESSDLSAIPFTFTEAEDQINMLDSDFFSGNYGSKYKTINIDDVMKVGRSYELYISEVHNPYKFWFQLDEQNPSRIDQLQEQLNMYYNLHESADFIKKNHMQKGYACAALYHKMWHRGEILCEPKDEKVKVFFVDYGTVDLVSISEIRYLLTSFCIHPKLCHRGVLDFVKPIKHRWEVETTTFFIGLIENKKLVAGVSEIDSKTNSVRLYVMDNNININLKLVCEGHAFPDDPRERYQRHIAEAIPTFDSLEAATYPTLEDTATLLQQNYDYEKFMHSTIIDQYDCFISQHTSEEEVIRRVNAFQKKKDEAQSLAKQRDAKVFLQYFEGILKNPFFTNPTTEEIEILATNPFLD